MPSLVFLTLSAVVVGVLALAVATSSSTSNTNNISNDIYRDSGDSLASSATDDNCTNGAVCTSSSSLAGNITNSTKANGTEQAPVADGSVQMARVDKYATIFIYCIGFPGNVLSFIVWIQKRMRHSSGCYLAALAMDDFVFLSLHVLFELHNAWGVNLLNTVVVCQLFPVFFLTAQYLGPLLVLGFTTERYISICHPFKREKFCSVRRAKMVIGILVTSALCLSGVQGYFFTMQESFINNGTHECGPRSVVSKGGSTSLYILWNLSIEILTFVLVPLTVLVLNILVIVEMKRLSRMEQVTIHGHAQRTSATTVMLLAVSFYLILTTVPVTIAYTLFYEFQYDKPANATNENTVEPLFQREQTYLLVLTWIKEFGTTQYAFNIIFYVVTGKIFRTELKRLFEKVLCGKLTLSISKEYSSLRSSFRRESTKTKSMWVSVNGHTSAAGTTTTTTSVRKPHAAGSAVTTTTATTPADRGNHSKTSETNV